MTSYFEIQLKITSFIGLSTITNTRKMSASLALLMASFTIFCPSENIPLPSDNTTSNLALSDEVH